MRIPVSKSDINTGRLTKVARALQKIWEVEKLSLMQAQNLLAVLMGYRNLHDLQSNLSDAPIAPVSEFSRDAIATSVAWQMFRRHNIPLLEAYQLASKLPFKELEVDKLTNEAAFEHLESKLATPVILDEFWYYANPHWEPRTPRLIDAGIPAYKYVIYRDRSMFIWSRLNELLLRLPTDLISQLRHEERYEAGTESDGVLEMDFITKELVPQAIRPLLDSIKTNEILPEGFSIQWVFSDTGECLGRVLCNESLGGIIPCVYGIDDDGIINAIANLLCGEVIEVEETAIKGQPVYRLEFGSRGFDLSRDMSFHCGATSLQERLVPWPSHITISEKKDRRILSGHGFVEQGQYYLRDQSEWLKSDDIAPRLVEVGQTLRGNLDLCGPGYIRSLDTIPREAEQFYRIVSSKLSQNLAAAQERLCKAEASQWLLELIANLASPNLLDIYCANEINECFPIRREDDEEDDQFLIEERSRGITMLEDHGNHIQECWPALAIFKPCSLGVLYLWNHGEYPGSRYCWFVDTLRVNDTKVANELLSCIALHASYAATSSAFQSKSYDMADVALAINAVREGEITPLEIPEFCADADRARKALERHEKFAKGVADWRLAEEKQRIIRGEGQFLYARAPIARERPKGIADFFAEMRALRMSRAL